MSITENTHKPNSPRLHCPNCTRHLPLDADPFTFCSTHCMEEFDDILTPSKWNELDELEGERGFINELR